MLSPGSSIPVQEKPSAGNVPPNCSYPNRSITLPTTKQSLRFLLETATPYMRLTLRNIGQRQEIFSCLISYLYANAVYEPGGREFESLRARQIIRGYNCPTRHYRVYLASDTN